MKERPILFSGAMVRAILDGRKMQTRRIVANVQRNNCVLIKKPTATRAGIESHVLDLPNLGLCPYGRSGDRLWVKETFLNNALPGYAPVWFYRADSDSKPSDRHWRPSIFMTRAASRITLEITGIRVELLKSISANDAIAEGIESTHPSQLCSLVYRDYLLRKYDPFEWFSSPRDSYQSLWEAINGPESWDANPWVWVIEFRRVNA